MNAYASHPMTPVPPSDKALPTPAKVTVLLATYNGAMFLPQQLASIAAQTHSDWQIVVSDDGSTDATREQLNAFARVHPLQVIDGPRQGFAANFMHLLCETPCEDYLAFADQDDVWDADHLARGIAALQQVPADIPALYGARTRLIDTLGNPCGMSSLFIRPPRFGNALVQSLAGGNTMMLNRAAHALLQRAGRLNVVSHDWWFYQLISGAGGRIIYDPIPSLSYRQHECNLVGANRGLVATTRRIRLLLQGRFAHWNDVQVQALQQSAALLSDENRHRLEWFMQARGHGLLKRLMGFIRAGIYRQTLVGEAGLWVAVLLKRI